MPQGLFLSLDGVDGAGKSTQCQKLLTWLLTVKPPVKYCRDPGGTQAGDQIRQLLLNFRYDMGRWCEAFLFLASRAQLVEEIIGPALRRGVTVICDRFVLANVVYQGHAGGLPVDRLWDLGRLSSGGLEPDLTFVLDLPADVSLKRKQTPADRMERRGLDFHEKVRAGFLDEAKKQPERIRIIDATRSVEDVFAEILRETKHVMDKRAGA